MPWDGLTAAPGENGLVATLHGPGMTLWEISPVKSASTSTGHKTLSGEIQARASDGLYQVTQQYPVSVVSRTCWKQFDDGAACPYAAHGSGGDATSCDYYFDSANGCRAHGMAPYFGGHPAQPQGVSIKDNSTG